MGGQNGRQISAAERAARQAAFMRMFIAPRREPTWARIFGFLVVVVPWLTGICAMGYLIGKAVTS